MSAKRRQAKTNMARRRSARGWSWRHESNLVEPNARRVYTSRHARTDAPRIFRTTSNAFWVGDWRKPTGAAAGPFATFEAAEIQWLLVKDEVLV